MAYWGESRYVDRFIEPLFRDGGGNNSEVQRLALRALERRLEGADDFAQSDRSALTHNRRSAQDQQGRQDERQAEEDVGDAADDRVTETAEVTGRGAQDDSEDRRPDRRQDGDRLQPTGPAAPA